MIIKEIPIDVFLEYAYCECGEELTQDNVVLTTYPAQYKYVCPKCKRVETSYEAYPRAIYKDKEGNVI